MSTSGDTTPLEADFAALRKLRDDDASGVLKEFFGDGENPREWKDEDGDKVIAEVEDGRVTGLRLYKCSIVTLPAAIGELGALTSLRLNGSTSLAALPDAIGKLGELTYLGLQKCTSLVALPDAIGELKALKALDLRGCSSLVEVPAAIGELGALTTLRLGGCTSLVALPDSIGKLGALSRLKLQSCSKLSTLPDSIGKLGALKELNLLDCSSLVELPEGIVEREELEVVPPFHLVSGQLAEDLAALQKLRDDASGALKEYFGDSEDPREWKSESSLNYSKAVTVSDGRVTKLNLYDCSSLAALPDAIGELKALTELELWKCSSLAALPDAIGELGALTELDLSGCSSLAALPDSIGKLGALTELKLYGCSSLTHPPKEMRGDVHKTVGFCCLNLLEGGNVPATDVKKIIVNDVIADPAHDERLDVLVRKDPALADIVKAAKAILAEDFAALRKLRDDDASGALKKYFGDGEDPREWKGVTMGSGRVSELNLSGCLSLVTLPDSIGELKALKTLNVNGCPSLTALPESISGLDALEALDVRFCLLLKLPPPHMRNVDQIKRLFANMTQLLNGNLLAIDASDVKVSFFEGALAAPSYADRLEAAVRKDSTIADLTNDKGQRAIDVACYECRRAMQRALFFLGRYAIADGPPEHRSATSLVVRAVDAAAADDYGRLFDEFDDGDGSLDADELHRLAAKLGTNVATLNLGDEKLTKTLFVDKLQRLFCKERKVVIKIFQVEEQWKNEKKARDDQQLDARYVVQTIEAPGDDEFTRALGESALFQEDRFGGSVGSHAIVMDAADRNLFQIYQSERPDLNKVRVLMRETMECVQHLHKKKLVHGDIKMLNVVRLALDHRLRLIDLDAAAKVSEIGRAKSYVGSKFSSAVLPPECFATLDTDQVKQFEAYFSDRDAELRKKAAPKVDSEGTSYVVKTFLVEDSRPKNSGDLPYELVEASAAVDYWSLGALLFQLVAGEPLVPSNRDDDCVDAYSMAALASWNDDAGKKRLVAITDPAARDLASKLLITDPLERANFCITDTLETHPFFKPPKPGDTATQEKLDKIIEQQQKDSMKLDTILKLSKENRDELRRTRDVLLKAVFEAAGGNTTPTTFVVLNKKLPTFTPDEEKWISENVKYKPDGLSFELPENVQWYADDLEARLKDSMQVVEKGMDIAKDLARFESPDKLTPANFKNLIKKGLGKLFPTTTLYFYLVDELTGKPVRGPGYPILITEPSEKLAQLLPVMQVGLHAMSAYNGVAGLAQMFGYPVPKVPKKFRRALQGSVDLLKQESSVAAFGVVHRKSKSTDKEATETVQGKALQELKNFLEANPKAKNYAGLRRIGDPQSGAAIWTKVKDGDLEVKLKERQEERLAEEEIHRKTMIAKSKAVSEVGDTTEPVSPVTPRNSESSIRGATRGKLQRQRYSRPVARSEARDQIFS